MDRRKEKRNMSYREEVEQVIVFLVGGLGLSVLGKPYVLELEKKYKILTFDYPYECNTNQKLCDGIAGLMEYLGIASAIFVGSSYGGYLSQIFARKYPEKTAGLCLFSTAGLNEDTIRGLSAKEKMADRYFKILRVVPYALLKPVMRRACMKHVVNASEEEYRYLKELFKEVFRNYTAKLDYHMTSLLVDIVKQKPCTAEDFVYLDDKVLLILPDEDDSFTPKMQQDLVDMMKNPVVVEHMDGGHLATLLRVEKYIETIDKFIKERICYE
ncbi:MAG: alpha/beta hydrolase [Lachnospiraceae bacterium]|nr:alpha/beta hydrolase [Lachnospiraceae bacterium]